MSSKYPSPLLGYNNNVRHKGKVFHIQTEDSGVRYGHIITHLFMDGGRILKSVKTGYAEHIGNERMADIVREMMKQQHKAMFIALRDGKFDLMADGRADASQATRAVASESSLKPMNAPSAPVSEPSMASRARESEAPPTIRQPQDEGVMLDIGALERAAAASNAAPVRALSDLPPPPPNLFREKVGTGKYRIPPADASPHPPSSTSASPHHAAAAHPAPPKAHSARPPNAVPRKPSQSALAAASERRYAPTRPASIFGQARPQHGKTIFGEDLLSDKSLDEVILSYLSEDLEEKK